MPATVWLGFLFKVALNDSFDIRKFCQTLQDLKVALSRGPNTQTFILACTYPAWRTRHELDARVNRFDFRFALARVRDTEFV